MVASRNSAKPVHSRLTNRPRGRAKMKTNTARVIAQAWRVDMCGSLAGCRARRLAAQARLPGATRDGGEGELGRARLAGRGSQCEHGPGAAAWGSAVGNALPVDA